MNTYTFNVVLLTGVEFTVIIKGNNVLEAHADVKKDYPFTSAIKIMGVKSNV